MPVTERTRRARRDRAGREERRRSHTARAREPDLRRWYRRTAEPLDPLDFELRLDLLRGRALGMVPLDEATLTFDWADEESMLTGSATFQRPDRDDPKSLPVEQSLQIRCRVRSAQQWRELWRMRAGAPQTDIEPDAVQVSVELKDDLDLVRRGRRKYEYRETKRRKHGWFGHDALIDAARQDGIRLGKIAKCKKRMSKIEVTGSLLDLAKKVYEDDAEETGRKFVMRMRNGRFEVVPFRRNRILYVIAPAIESASWAAKPKAARPVTVIDATARIGRGDSSKKVTYTHVERRLVQKFGWVQKERKYGRVKSFSELRRKVKRELADQFTLRRTATVEIPGLPFLQRGDGAMLLMPTEGFEKEESFVWVRGIRHSASGDRYTTSVDFDREDPYEKYQRRVEERKRKDARKRRSRRRGDRD